MPGAVRAPGMAERLRDDLIRVNGVYFSLSNSFSGSLTLSACGV